MRFRNHYRHFCEILSPCLFQDRTFSWKLLGDDVKVHQVGDWSPQGFPVHLKTGLRGEKYKASGSQDSETIYLLVATQTLRLSESFQVLHD